MPSRRTLLIVISQSACRRQNVDDELVDPPITPGALGPRASLNLNGSSAISKNSFAEPSGSSHRTRSKRRLWTQLGFAVVVQRDPLGLRRVRFSAAVSRTGTSRPSSLMICAIIETRSSLLSNFSTLETWSSWPLSILRKSLLVHRAGSECAVSRSRVLYSVALAARLEETFPNCGQLPVAGSKPAPANATHMAIENWSACLDNSSRAKLYKVADTARHDDSDVPWH